MTQAAIYLLTAVDVRRLSQPEFTRKTVISTLTLPPLNLLTTEHNPGGGTGAVNFAIPRVEAPEPAFNAKGIDTDIFTGFGEVDRWLFAGSYKKRGPGGGGFVPGRAIIEGAITGWEADESDPAEFQGSTHAFNEVTHYEFSLDGEELFYWDFWEGVIRFKGRDITQAQRTALGA
ncbi:phage major tail tube protein [Devosia sp. SD17-2]|uniref:phage major tail tube protein n=1 Tax=Devosia sp. SD17-2 TaxID=2976459 RepID=UPI0023D7D014|nr:phage major tail tube protein [Devosia sp. SD17-2]WEJ33855.1 phage major tail tube protein [Devosia sp. SD17-2]